MAAPVRRTITAPTGRRNNRPTAIPHPCSMPVVTTKPMPYASGEAAAGNARSAQKSAIDVRGVRTNCGTSRYAANGQFDGEHAPRSMNRVNPQRALVWLFAVNVCLILVTWSVSPERVAIHFGAGGMADGWATRDMAAVLMLASTGVPFLFLRWGGSLLHRIPERFVSLPFRNYWLSTPERRQAVIMLMDGLLAKLGAGVMLLFLVLQVFTLAANRKNPPQLWEAGLLIVLILFLVWVGLWIVDLWKSLTPPSNGHRAP